jgi:hypothetical protein
MKIYQLLQNKVQLPVTNEEQNFIQRHKHNIRLTALDERDTLLAQNLVRKGVYSISKDNNTLIKAVNESTT